MDDLQKSQFLGEEKINKLMLKFSIPTVLSLLVSVLYNIVDQIFIGNSELSTLGNSATGVVFPIFIISQAFAWCFGDGSGGKQIGKRIAKELGIPFYYKEMTALAAQESGLSKEFISELNANSPQILHSLYMSTDVV